MLTRRSVMGWLGALAGGAAATAAAATAAKSEPAFDMGRVTKRWAEQVGGGAHTHTLTTEQLPAHTHTFTPFGLNPLAPGTMIATVGQGMWIMGQDRQWHWVSGV